MMKDLIKVEELSQKEKHLCGGKAWNLKKLGELGFKIPATAVLLTRYYDKFIDNSGLRGMIFREIGRKEFAQMRWEELWDISLRIKSLFLKSDFSKKERLEIKDFIESSFGNSPLAARSSAPGEDGKMSFAGLHESYVNITDFEELLNSIKLVWASLWSVSALLYRRELKLDPAKSSMAVVIQEMINGDISGVAFSRAPDKHDQTAVEAVYGLNQGLVDGTVEPDRWHVSRDTGKITSHFPPASRKSFMAPSDSGASLIDLPPEKASSPPLKEEQITQAAQSAMRQEEKWKHPRDTEWTFINDDLFVLQSRPITESFAKENDGRQWYQNLLQSFEKLKETREIIEKSLLPEMLKDGIALEKEKLDKLTNKELLNNIQKRRKTCIKYHQAYYEYCIPFAHGTRLFGEIYNEKKQPDDPYEFVELLRSDEMKSLKRNEAFFSIAQEINSKNLKSHLLNKVFEDFPKDLSNQISELASDLFGKKINSPAEAPDSFWTTLAKFDGAIAPRDIKENLKNEFLKKFKPDEKKFAAELIDLARASYRLRDDDNLYIVKIENELERALEEARKRQSAQPSLKDFEDEIKKGTPELRSSPKITNEKLPENYKIDYRQLVGQPAGKGLAKAKAKVINDFQDLFDFQKGEIMICDAVEPEMTFVAPLAAAIVERRGGMLIHGAIIAREYGLPCVTGVPAATERIKTGDTITVDGWLGIVTIDRTE